MIQLAKKLFARFVGHRSSQGMSADLSGLLQEIERLGYREPFSDTTARVERQFLDAVASLSSEPVYGLDRVQAFSVYQAYAAHFTAFLHSRLPISIDGEGKGIPAAYRARLLELGKRHAQAVRELCIDLGAASDANRSMQ